MRASYDNFIYSVNDESFKWHINNGFSEPYPRELALVKKYLSIYPTRNTICLDVGGHIGTTALPYSRLFKEVIAFEPNKPSYDLFLENIMLNAVSNITVHNKGVYNKNTHCKVLAHSQANSGCFYIKECDTMDVDTIETVKLDDLDLDGPVDFLKIDTEGSELYVLEGSRDIITKYKPLIQVETNDCSNKYFGYDKEKIFEFMKQHEYSIFDDNGNNPLFIHCL